ETGVLFAGPVRTEAPAATSNGHSNGNGHANGHADGNGHASGNGHANGHAANGQFEAELRLVARDGKGVPLLSSRAWETPAIERIVRVPSGFMRDRTQERVEALATERGLTTVDLGLVEEGIELGRQAMEAMIAE